MASEQSGSEERKDHLAGNDEKSISRSSALENFSFLKEVIRFDEETNEISAANTDWLILRGELLRELFDGFRRFLGREGANIAIKAAGKNSGRRFVDVLSQREIKLDEADMILSVLLNQGGWGKVEMDIKRATKTANFSITNCVTARKIKSTEPSCYFLAGYFEGFCEKLFKVELECIETACEASGDLACEFQVKPKNASNS